MVDKRKAKRISQSAYARRAKVSRQAVSKAIKAGRITRYGSKIDPDLADAEWLARTDPARGGKGRPPALEDPGTYMEHKTRREKYAALKAEVDYEIQMDRLVDRQEVEAAAFQSSRTARDALYDIPDRLADQLAGVTDAHECYLILRREIDAVCALIATPPTPRRRKEQ